MPGCRMETLHPPGRRCTADTCAAINPAIPAYAKPAAMGASRYDREACRVLACSPDPFPFGSDCGGSPAGSARRDAAATRHPPSAAAR